MAGIYELYVEAGFAAAHCLEGYEGNCSRVHGHNWRVRVYLKCRELDSVGIGLDFRQIRKDLQDLLDGLDHKHLNDLEPFRAINPTSENIARYLYGELTGKINSGEVSVSRVRVSETGNTGVTYWEE